MDADRFLHYVRTYPVGTRVQYTFVEPAVLATVVGHMGGSYAAIVIQPDGTDNTVTVGTLYLRKVDAQ